MKDLETYCTFDASKLLKIVGFNIQQETQYSENGNRTTVYNYSEATCKLYNDIIQRPTHETAVNWIWKKFNIYISTRIEEKSFVMTVVDMNLGRVEIERNTPKTHFPTKEATLDAAIMYVLQQLN